ncbi:pickpocket protein 19-like [Periplaneta americana]|uniref:pickpocket protein 19-like n=1 Tax=Periplaneta americana TaxID=6978 RepID=UPI0037E8C398
MEKSERSKKYDLLKTSWTYQTQEYFENSTLHGVRYIRESGRPFCEKFIWFCFTSVGGLVTLIIIVSLWEKFQTNPTITGLDTDFHNWDVPFPAVSFCPLNPINASAVEEYIEEKWSQALDDRKKHYRNFLTQIGNISYNNFNKFLNFRDGNETNIPNDGYSSILEKVVIKCEAFISKCTFKAEPFDCCNALKPLLTEVGYCLAFNSKFAGGGIQPRSEGEFKLEYVHETDHKWSLTMEVDNGNEVLGTLNPVRVYIHSTEDYPVIDVPPQHVWDQKIQKISFNPKQTYTTEGARQLTIKQRKCVYEDEIRLVTSDIYTYRSCMIQCRMALARKLCKCVPFLYKKLDGFKYCDLNGMQCLGKNEDKLKAASCPCELGCSNTVYEVEKLVGDNNQNSLKELEVGFVSWPMVRYKREVLFGWVDLLVSFGGIAGLFLGFSLLSGVEIIYYFTMRALCMVYRNKEDLQRLQEEYKKAEKPPLDLRLTPTFMRKNRENAARNTNPSSITTVKPGINFISATPMQNFPTTTLTQRVNKPGFHKPIYSKFEFLD